MKEKQFLCVFPWQGHLITELTNLAIVSLNKKAKMPAHVTVAGPIHNAENYNFSRMVTGEEMEAISIGNFNPKNGSRPVFLEIQCPILKKGWNKPDYPNQFTPHLTIYSGEDHSLSRRVEDILVYYSSKTNTKTAYRAQGAYVFCGSQPFIEHGIDKNFCKKITGKSTKDLSSNDFPKICEKIFSLSERDCLTLIG